MPTPNPTPTALPPDPWLTPNTIADELGVSVMTIYRNVNAGRLAATRVGGKSLRIRRSAVDAWLAADSTPAAS